MTDLVLNSGRRFLRVSVGIRRKLFRPEILNHRILHVVDNFFSIFFIGVHAINAEQGRVRIFQESEERVRKDVFHTRTPRVLPYFLEGRHEAGHDEMALVIADVLHHVEGDGMLHVKRREIDDIFHAVLRHIVKQSFNGAAVRIYEGETLATLQVLNRHVFKDGGLSHPRLADDVGVAIAVLRLDAEWYMLPARISGREICYAFRILHCFQYSKN